MKTGRPPTWNPVAAVELAAWTEVATLTSKTRLGFPIAVRQRLEWLSKPADGLLGVVDAEGSVELLPWTPYGEKQMAQVAMALGKAEPAARGALALAAMDRFVRLTLDPDGRTVLPANLVSHLEATDGSVRIVTRDLRLWLWSEAKWQAGRPARLALLSVSLEKSSA
jgi:DNA-binding transcriptional regulator/RsmH inhibitor MraZ